MYTICCLSEYSEDCFYNEAKSYSLGSVAEIFELVIVFLICGRSSDTIADIWESDEWRTDLMSSTARCVMDLICCEFGMIKFETVSHISQVR